MITDISEFKRLIKDTYPDMVETGNGVFSLSVESMILTIACVSDESNAIVFRAKIDSLDNIKRAGDLSKAALKGNFFWSGTDGAKLSIGPDNALYLTELRSAEEFLDAATLMSAVDEYVNTVSDWKIRSQQYA